MEPMIRIENVSKTFRGKENTVEALKGITLEIGAGDIYGIIGMSGAGKSTLVRCLNFLERPTEGTVYVEGKDLSAMSEKELRRMRTRVAIIDAGVLAESGTVEEVFASPKSRAAKRLVFQGERKVSLMKSKRCIRIVFTENSSFEPVIANMVLECRASVNILLADTKDIGGIARGQMVLQLPEDEQTAEKMIAYLKERNLAVEELTDYVE